MKLRSGKTLVVKSAVHSAKKSAVHSANKSAVHSAKKSAVHSAKKSKLKPIYQVIQEDASQMNLRNGKAINNPFILAEPFEFEYKYISYISNIQKTIDECSLESIEKINNQFILFQKTMKSYVKQNKKLVKYSSRIPLIIGTLENIFENINLFFSPVVVANSDQRNYCLKYVAWMEKTGKNLKSVKTLSRYTSSQLNSIKEQLQKIQSLWDFLEN